MMGVWGTQQAHSSARWGQDILPVHKALIHLGLARQGHCCVPTHLLACRSSVPLGDQLRVPFWAQNANRGWSESPEAVSPCVR